jgi:hypothetical protein
VIISVHGLGLICASVVGTFTSFDQAALIVGNWRCHGLCGLVSACLARDQRTPPRRQWRDSCMARSIFAYPQVFHHLVKLAFGVSVVVAVAFKRRNGDALFRDLISKND